jgi:hypothetical protein
MKPFLIRFFLFVLLLFLLAEALDLFLSRNLLKSKFSEFGVWGDIEGKRVKNIDLVIMGSSRAFTMIDPKILEDSLGGLAYNVGVDGYNFHMQHLFYKEIMANDFKPKCIIQELDLHTLAKRKDLYNADQFIAVLRNPTIKEYVDDYQGFDIYDYYLPLVRWSGRTNTLFVAFKNVCRGDLMQDSYDRYHGFQSRNETWHPNADAEFSTGKYDQVLDTPSIALFESYLKECRKNKINVIFVFPPIYHEILSLILNKEKIMDYYMKIAKSNGIPVLNYTLDSLSYSKHYFYNSGHLNSEGSSLFSRHLAHDIHKLHVYTP